MTPSSVSGRLLKKPFPQTAWDKTGRLDSTAQAGVKCNALRLAPGSTLGTNARYVPRVEPGASLRALHLTPACAVESNLPVLSQAVWGNGFFNSRPDTDDGVIRYYPLIAQYRGSMGVPNESGREAATPKKQNDLFAPLGIRLLERYLQERYGNA